MPYYGKIPAEMKTRLQGNLQVFLAEKHFEGCGGLPLTDRVRLVIAAHACILLLGEEFGFYRGLDSILVYPAAFIPQPMEADPSGVVEEEPEEHEGESWDRGAVIFSWEDIQLDLERLDGRNVLFHEFAHQLYDKADDVFSGRAAWEAWMEVFQRHYERHVRNVARGRDTFLDEYGAQDPGEFFAVVTEEFFERPMALQRRYPDLYQQFQEYYRQDPAAYFRKEDRA